jgi:hypothetical protein
MLLDYTILSNLHATLHHRPAQWNKHSLHQCIIEGFLERTGDTLTRKGRDIAEQFDRYVRLLESGIPLTARIPKPTRSFTEKVWRKAEFGKKRKRVTFTRSFLYSGSPRGDERQPARYLERDLVEPFYQEIKAYIALFKISYRVFPVAYQVFQGHEAIVLKPAKKQTIFRIDPQYFDLCQHRFLTATYWIGSHSNPSDPIAIRVTTGKSTFSNDVNALLKPLDSRGWPDVDLSVFENECVVREQKAEEGEENSDERTTPDEFHGFDGMANSDTNYPVPADDERFSLFGGDMESPCTDGGGESGWTDNSV